MLYNFIVSRTLSIEYKIVSSKVPSGLKNSQSMRVHFIALEEDPTEIDAFTQKVGEEVHDRFIFTKNFGVSTGIGILSFAISKDKKSEIIDLNLNLLGYDRVKEKNESYGENSMSLLRHPVCNLKEIFNDI